MYRPKKKRTESPAPMAKKYATPALIIKRKSRKQRRINYRYWPSGKNDQEKGGEKGQRRRISFLGGGKGEAMSASASDKKKVFEKHP